MTEIGKNKEKKQVQIILLWSLYNIYSINIRQGIDLGNSKNIETIAKSLGWM